MYAARWRTVPSFVILSTCRGRVGVPGTRFLVLTAVHTGLVYRRVILVDDTPTTGSVKSGTPSCNATIQSIRGQHSLDVSVTCRLQVAKMLVSPHHASPSRQSWSIIRQSRMSRVDSIQIQKLSVSSFRRKTVFFRI